MGRLRQWFTLAGLSLAAALLPVQAAEVDVSEGSLAHLLKCMAEKVPSGAQSYTIALTSIDPTGGERRTELDVAIGSDEQNRSLRLRAISPSDVAGTAYLIRRTQNAQQVYVYLPSQASARALAPGQDLRLFGSDLPASMFGRLLLDLPNQAVTAAGEEQYQGASLKRLYVTAPGRDDALNSMLKLLVDPQDCDVRYMSLQNNGRTEMEMTAPPGTFKNGPVPGAKVEITALRDGTKTRLEILSANSSEELSPRYFHPREFHKK